MGEYVVYSTLYNDSSCTEHHSTFVRMKAERVLFSTLNVGDHGAHTTNLIFQNYTISRNYRSGTIGACCHKHATRSIRSAPPRQKVRLFPSVQICITLEYSVDNN